MLTEFTAKGGGISAVYWVVSEDMPDPSFCVKRLDYYMDVFEETTGTYEYINEGGIKSLTWKSGELTWPT